MPRAAYLAVLGAAVLCYAALGAVLRILPELVTDPAALGLLVGAGRRSATSGSPTSPGSPPGRCSPAPG